MMWIRYSLGMFASLVFALASFASDASNPRVKLMQGEYAAAFAEAEKLKTADGQALAAEVLLTEIMLGRAKKNKKQARLARKIALQAFEIDPDHQNARLQYAIADGFITRETSNVSAWMKRLPQKTHAIVKDYRDDFPDDPRGDALLGAWHLAIARKAGDKNAIKWFDASIADGRSLFLAARAEQPKDVVIGLNYAFSLLALGDDDLKDTEEARLILIDLASMRPEDHLGKTLQAYGREALTRIEDRDEVRDYVGMFLDGDMPE